MKTIALTTAALLITAISFAQTGDKANNSHGAKVSSTTQSTTETNGSDISTVASSKSQADLHRKNTDDAKALKEARKEELKALKAEANANHSDDGEALIDFKANAKAHKEARKEARENGNHSTKIKGGTKAGANVGVGRTKIKTNAGAGLRLGL